MWNVSYNSHGEEHVEYKNFYQICLSIIFVKELEQKGYSDIKITEYQVEDVN